MDEAVHNQDDFLHELLPDWVLGPYSPPFPVRGPTASIRGQSTYENLELRSTEGVPGGASPRMRDRSLGKDPKGSASQS